MSAIKHKYNSSHSGHENGLDAKRTSAQAQGSTYFFLFLCLCLPYSVWKRNTAWQGHLLRLAVSGQLKHSFRIPRLWTCACRRSFWHFVLASRVKNRLKTIWTRAWFIVKKINVLRIILKTIMLKILQFKKQIPKHGQKVNWFQKIPPEFRGNVPRHRNIFDALQVFTRLRPHFEPRLLKLLRRPYHRRMGDDHNLIWLIILFSGNFFWWNIKVRQSSVPLKMSGAQIRSFDCCCKYKSSEKWGQLYGFPKKSVELDMWSFNNNAFVYIRIDLRRTVSKYKLSSSTLQSFTSF